MKSKITNCDCSCQECPLDTKLCPSSQTCVEEEKWCDGVQDCPDDEKDCFGDELFTTEGPEEIVPTTTG